MTSNTGIRIVAFDFDGTLSYNASSWRKLHQYFGTKEKSSINLELYENGDIDYEEFMRLDISAWPKDLHISRVEKIVSDGLQMRPDAVQVVSEIKRKGLTVAIVSAGLDVLISKIGNELKVDHVLANGLETDSKGYVTGNGIFRVDLLRKDLALLSLLGRIGLTADQCLSVGDSKYDSAFLTASGSSAAIQGDEELEKVATYVLPKLADVLNYV
ncbi:MAG: HAD-IB family phosphatase [Nitrososphaerales archaeon]